jgi:thioredoxin 1
MKDVDLGMPINVIDIDHDTAMTTKYQIRGVPTLIILEDGKEVKRMSGVKKLDELKQWLQN